ncbi:MAG: hypothetical protein AAGH99_00450 [Planctomycetota bacterium]
MPENETANVVEPQNFAELLQAMPAAWTVLLTAAVVVGLVLWAFGGRLAEKGAMLTGFVLGGLGAAALAAGLSSGTIPPEVAEATGEAGEVVAERTSNDGLWILAIGIGGALAGVLLAWLLFRFWMAATAATLLAAVVPIVAMIWTGNPPPMSSIQGAQDVTLDALGAGESDPEAERLRALALEKSAEARSAFSSSSAKDRAVAAADALFDRERFYSDLQGVWRQQVDEVKLWWSEMDPGARRFLVAGAGVGAVIGLVLGLILPAVAASLQTAMVGSVLILFAGRTLLLRYVPGAEGLMPGSWRGVLLSLGLITLLGVLIQWTMRKKTDDD